MEEKQEQKYHVCRICEHKFSSGRQLGGHMWCHLAINSDRRKQGIQEIKQEAINVDMGVDVYAVDRQITKQRQDLSNQDNNNVGRKRGLDDGVNVHVMRKNAKRSWSGSSSSKYYGNYVCKHCGKEFESSKDLDELRRSHTRKDVMENDVCRTCGKVFESLNAFYGHMSCHSMKRASKECDDGVGNHVKKKRSITGYTKCSKPCHVGSVLSSDEDGGVDDEAIGGAVCLMMLSIGVKELDGVKLKASKQPEFVFQEFVCKRIVKGKVDGGLDDGVDDEVIGGAICLMMLSKGVKELDGVKLKASNQPEFAIHDYGYKRIVEGRVDGDFGVL